MANHSGLCALRRKISLADPSVGVLYIYHAHVSIRIKNIYVLFIYRVYTKNRRDLMGERFWLEKPLLNISYHYDLSPFTPF